MTRFARHKNHAARYGVLLFLMLALGFLMLSFVSSGETTDPPLPSFNQTKSVQYSGPFYAPPFRTFHNFVQPPNQSFNASVFTQDIQRIKAAGFNTVWLISFWKDFQPQGNPPIYDATAFSNLNTALTILEQNGMYAILPLNYGVGCLFPDGVSVQLWLFDNGLWQIFENYVSHYASQIASHHNVYYMFFTEQTEPCIYDKTDRCFTQDPIKLDFQAWASSFNGEVNYWNRRWGSNFGGIGQMFFPGFCINGYYNCPDNPACTYQQCQYRNVDYNRWQSWLIRNRFGRLPALIRAHSPTAPIGYHDYSLITKDFINDDFIAGDPPINDEPLHLPVPPPPNINPFDFFSFDFYPLTLSEVHNAASELSTRYQRFVKYYGYGPRLLGEVGLSSSKPPPADYPQTDLPDPVPESLRVLFFQTNGLPYLEQQDLGFNFWNWHDAAPGEYPCCDTGLCTASCITFPETLWHGSFGFVDVNNSSKQLLGYISPTLGGCLNLPVRINRVPPVYYSTLGAAYNAAVNGETIQSQAVDFTENLFINKSITLDGGYDCDYTGNLGTTLLKGALITSSGTSTIGNFKLQN